MEIDIKTTLQTACRALLRPVVSVLLRSGMTWKEFSDLSKSVYVAVASEEFGIRGRPTNVSRVSILTGMSRKEVKRQREILASQTTMQSSKTTDATRLLSGWHQDDEYLDEAGKPIALRPTGPAPSMESLFDRYGGDTPKQTLIKELQKAGSMTVDDDGNFVALRRYHMPAKMDVGMLRFFGTNLHDHARTLSNNLSGEPAQRRLEGFAVDDRIHPDSVDEFRQFADQRGQQFLEEVDDWLNRHRVDSNINNDPEINPVRLGLGVYAIEGLLPEGTLS